MESRAYAIFTKKKGEIYRTETYMQFGQSDAIIGACILCNPGSCKLKDKRLQAKLEASEVCEFIKHEATRDDTMRQLEQILTQMYGEALQGRFMIYNLFTLKNADMQQAANLLADGRNTQELIASEGCASTTGTDPDICQSTQCFFIDST